MNTISIGELQKNISLLTQIDEIFTIIDKRKNRKVATIYPERKHSMIASMAGKYRDRVRACDDLEIAKGEAIKEAMEEKYGLSA
jgi:hypothetical protein